MPEIKTAEDIEKWREYLRKTIEAANLYAKGPTSLIGLKFVFYPTRAHIPIAGIITGLEWTESTISIEISKKFLSAPDQPIVDITFATGWADGLWRLHHYDQNDKGMLRAVAGHLQLE